MTPYYEDESVTIYQGDCAEIMPQLSGVDAVITDPPYGVGIKYGPGYDDSRADYWDWLRDRIKLARDLARVVVFTHRVRALQELTDWDWVGVWNKPMSFGARVGNSPLLPHWEPIIMYGVFGLGTMGSPINDVIRANPERGGTLNKHLVGRDRIAVSDEAIGHPLPKPLTLFRSLVGSFSPGGGTVVDPFMGSGTTLRAAKDLGRRAIGIEIEERYCEIAVQRLAQEVLPL